MKVLIVDGYNVIRLTPPYRDLADRDMEAARSALLGDVAVYAQGEWQATVVFDGGANPHSTGAPEEFAGISVVFSRFGSDADSVVEALARSARERGDSVEVVTSDAQTQWAVMGGSVARRSSKEFARELEGSRAEWREHAPLRGAKVRLEERIDPETRDRLDRLVHGDD